MIFGSISFLLYFLPAFIILYRLTPEKYKNMTLLSGSLVFYALGNPWHLLFLGVSVLVNYYVGLYLGAEKVYKGKHKEKRYKKNRSHKKEVLAAAVILNVAVLILGKGGKLPGGMPLGISFYTFQIISYLVDVFKGDVRSEKSFVNLATYVAMFPKLVSGPIVYYGEVADALNKRRMTLRGVEDGLKTFTLGLAAKVLLADRIGLLWNEVQVTGFENISTPLAWMAAVAYSLKLYFDFCGYSLMAMGLGRVFGFSFPENFRTPYMALSVRDFYRRWHITLGRWFWRYVYVPLGGSKRGRYRTVRNLFVVWVLTALWHGTTFNFLLWGLLLFALIVLERQVESLWKRYAGDGPARRKWLRIPCHLYLWAVIPVTWMCFAITDTSQLLVYLGRMFGRASEYTIFVHDWEKALENYGLLFLASFAACTPLLGKIYRKWKNSLLGAVMLAALFWLCVWRISVEGNNPFMYVNF